MAWWHHRYNSSVYPDVFFDDLNTKTWIVIEFDMEALLSPKFTSSLLSSAQKNPSKQIISQKKQCTALVSFTTNETPLWLPVSCSEPLAVPYICEKVKVSSSFTELQASPHVTCNKGFVFFKGECYKLYSNLDSFTAFWRAHLICEFNSEAHLVTGGIKYARDLLRAWNIHKDVPVYDISKEIVFTSVLCKLPSIPVPVSCGSGFFECTDKSCILNMYLCDGHSDCLNGEDEKDCDSGNHHTISSFYFNCTSNGPGISISLLCNGKLDCENGRDEERSLCSDYKYCTSTKRICDGVVDCLDGEDEVNCDYCTRFNCSGEACINTALIHFSPGWCRPLEFGASSDKACSQYSSRYSPCSSSDPHCFPRHKVCLLEHDRLGGVLHCPSGGHLENCRDIECPQKFKCHRSYCIHMSKVCNGIKDCVHGEDENICHDKDRCVGKLRCRNSQLCLSIDQFCDNRFDCPYGDDEELCTSSWCPESCTCSAHAVHCPNGLMYYVSHFIPQNIISLMLKHNLLLSYDFAQILSRFKSLLFLDVGYNKLTYVTRPLSHTDIPLQWLSLEGNHILYVSYFDFSDMKNLRYLNLRENNLKWIGAHGFSLLTSLPDLSLSNLGIIHIASFCISEMPALVSMNVSDNRISYLSSYVFSGAKLLSTLDLRNNPISWIDDFSFATAWHLHTIYMPEFKFCCLMHRIHFHKCDCFPKVDPANVVSSCDDLLSQKLLRGCVWVIGIIGILVNLFTVVWRRQTQKRTPFSLLVQHLGMADSLMGLYLLMIGGADSKYRNEYYLVEKEWRASPLCKIAGFVSMVSCEMSIFLLVLITIDRIGVAGLGRKGIGRKTVRTLLTCGWIMWISLSILPIVGMSYFGGHEYIKHGVCYLFNLSEGKSAGWEFTTAIFVTFNSFCVLFLIIGYSFVFISIQCKVGDMTPTKALARRLTMVIATNCICWLPPITCGIVALNGHFVHPKIITWIAVLVLPINSMVNPFLYTLTISHVQTRCPMIWRKKGRRDSDCDEIQQAELPDHDPEYGDTDDATHVAHAGARPKTGIFNMIEDTLI